MPTRGRQSFAAKALASYLTQTYQNRELVILDDADCPSFDKPPEFEGVRYFLNRNKKRLNIAQKRNQVNALALGDVIAHFDSDDWSAPERLALQMKALEDSGLQFCGCHTIIFWQEKTRKAFRYHLNRTYVLGTSQVYTKAFWRANHFDERKQYGSDNVIGMAADRTHQKVTMNGKDLIVARVHSDNTSPKQIGRSWKPIAATEVPSGFFL